MTAHITTNIRFLLWRKNIPREQWVAWLASRSNLNPAFVQAIVMGTVTDSQVGEAECAELARTVGPPSEAENLRFADLVGEGCNVLRENMSHLMNALGHGGKKALAAKLSVDPTTVSRWLNGSSQPNDGTLRQLTNHFGLSPNTDLRKDPVFLSVEPIALTERKQWLISRLEALSADEFRDLYPALRRMLGPQ